MINLDIKRSFQVTNVKQPPVWKKQTFMDYKQQVQNWKQHNSGDDYSKYQDFINELQKNNNIKGLEEYMSTVVIPMTKNDQTVDAVLKYLEEQDRETRSMAVPEVTIYNLLLKPQAFSFECLYLKKTTGNLSIYVPQK